MKNHKKTQSFSSPFLLLLSQERLLPLQLLEKNLFNSLVLLDEEIHDFHQIFPEKQPISTVALSTQFSQFKQEYYKVLTEIFSENQQKINETIELQTKLQNLTKSSDEKLKDIKLRLEIEQSKNELYERNFDISQKEAENMREKLIDFASRLDKEADGLTKRKYELDQEVERASKSKIQEIELHYQEKQKKLLEAMSVTDEKVVNQERISAELQLKVQDLLINNHELNKSLEKNEFFDAVKNSQGKFIEIEMRLKTSEKNNEEYKSIIENLKKEIFAYENDKKAYKKEIESFEVEKKRYLSEKKELIEKLRESESVLEQKTAVYETLQTENHEKIIEIEQEWAIEREELIQRLKKYEKDEGALKKLPSQSQGYSPLPKEFESKFDNLDDFKLETQPCSPRNRYSTHTNVNALQKCNSDEKGGFLLEVHREKSTITNNLGNNTDFDEKSYFIKKSESSAIKNENSNKKPEFLLDFNKINKDNIALKQEIEKYREELTFSKKSIETLRDAKTEIQKQFERLAQDLTRLRNENNQKDIKMLGLLREIEDLKNKINEKENEKKAFLDKIKALEGRIEDYKKEMKEIEEKKEKEIKKIRENMKNNQGIWEKLLVFEKMVKDKEKIIIENERKIKEIEDFSNERNAEIEKLKKEINEKHEIIQAFEEKIKIFNSDALKMNQKFNDLAKEINEKQDKLDKYRDNEAKNAKILKEYEVKIERLEGKIKDLESKCEEYKKNIETNEDFKRIREIYEGSIKDLEIKCQELKKNQEKSEELKKLKELYESSLKEKDRLYREDLKKIKEIEALLKEKELKIIEKDAILNETEHLLRIKDEKIKEKDLIISEKNENIKVFEDSLKNKIVEINEKDKEINKKNLEIQEKIKEIAEKDQISKNLNKNSKDKEILLGKIVQLEQNLMKKIKENEFLRNTLKTSQEKDALSQGKLQALEKNKLNFLQMQRDINSKNQEILQKNKEITILSQNLKQMALNLENERRKAFNTKGNSAIFIDDPNIKDLEISGLKNSLKQKQIEVDKLKEKIEQLEKQENSDKNEKNKEKLNISILTPKIQLNTSNTGSGNPTLLLRALEKKDLEIKNLTAKNGDLCLNLQNALNKINDLLKNQLVTQNTTTNVIVNNGTPNSRKTFGKSDGVVFDKNWQKLLIENEKMKQELPRIERLLLKSRLDAVEERACLQNELKIAEEKAVEFKIKLAQMAFDKDYYLIKYQGILKDIERNGEKKGAEGANVKKN